MSWSYGPATNRYVILFGTSDMKMLWSFSRLWTALVIWTRNTYITKTIGKLHDCFDSSLTNLTHSKFISLIIFCFFLAVAMPQISIESKTLWEINFIKFRSVLTPPISCIGSKLRSVLPPSISCIGSKLRSVLAHQSVASGVSFDLFYLHQSVASGVSFDLF